MSSTYLFKANRIFVRKLPWSVGQTELREYFKQFGHVVRAVVFFDKQTGLSRNQAIVQFAHQDVFHNVMTQSHHIDGQLVELEDHQNRDLKSKSKRLNINSA